MSLHCLADLCRLAFILLSLASACFWFIASITKATKPDKDLGIEMEYKDKKGREIYLNATAKRQSKFNAIAAVLLGLAIIFQLAASFLDSIQSR
jgi:hypothetical protein